MLFYNLIFFHRRWEISPLPPVPPLGRMGVALADSLLGSHGTHATTRRNCKEFAVDKQCSGRERLTHSAPFCAMMQAALLARDED